MNDEQHQAMLDLYQANMARIRGFFEGIEPHQWNMATPCEEWSVRDLTGHIVGGMLMFGTVAGGGEFHLVDGDRRLLKEKIHQFTRRVRMVAILQSPEAGNDRRVEGIG